MFIYYTIVQTYSTFLYALHFVFSFFVLLQRIPLLINLASSTVSKIVVGKIRGKMDRRCRSSGKSRSRSQGQGVPCDLEKKAERGEITEPRDATENKGCLSTPRFLSSVIPFILSVSSFPPTLRKKISRTGTTTTYNP